MEIKIKYFDGAKKIEKINIGDWIDLRARETVELAVGNYYEIPLGVAMKLPAGYEAHIAPRSSTFKKWGILQTNSVAVIDNSYCGNDDEWKFPALALRRTTIYAGDRICQFRIVKNMPEITFKEVDKLYDKNRGGYGTTGRK